MLQFKKTITYQALFSTKRNVNVKIEALYPGQKKTEGAGWCWRHPPERGSDLAKLGERLPELWCPAAAVSL